MLGLVVFDGERAYRIDLETASGLRRTHYISVESFLPLGDEREVEVQRESSEDDGPPHRELAHVGYSDFHEVNGVMVPFRIRWQGSDDRVLKETVMTVERCRVVDSAVR
jgi:hypothetical protein